MRAHFLCRHPCGGNHFLRPFLPLFAFGLLEAIPAFSATTMLQPGQRQLLGRVHVPFVENRGQMDRRVAFAAQTFFGSVFVTRDGRLVYSLPPANGDRDPSARSDGLSGWTLTEGLIGGDPAPAAGPRSPTGVSYFLGKAPRLWKSDVPAYEEVRLGEVWKGVRVSLRALGGNVEKIFTVMPGTRVGAISLRLDGARSLRIEPNGALVAATGDGEVLFSPPAAYQERHGVRYPVTAAYVLRRYGYGFRLGDYDRSLPVVVDPLLQSTYLGGSEFDRVNAIAIHPTGEILVAGYTASANFPGTAGGARPAFVGPFPGYDAFVARLNPSLTELLQATYLGGGGSSTLDTAQSIAIDATTGNILIAGSTNSIDFPGTAGGAQPASAGSNEGFIACLNPMLTSLLQATYLGGSSLEYIGAIAVHPTTQELLVVGATDGSDLPGTAGGAQPGYGGGGDVFVARLNLPLTSLLQATYLGGTGYDDIGISAFASIAVDPTSGDIFVGGLTFSTDFPGTTGGAQAASAGGGEGFIARLNSTLTVLEQSTYLGGADDDEVDVLARHPTGDIFVSGMTRSTDLPATAGGAQSAKAGGWDVFAARLDPSLTTLEQTTYLGGGGDEEVHTIAVHPTTGEVFVAGLTRSSDLPGTSGGAQPAMAGNFEGFVARLGPALTTLEQATYLGGSLDDGAHGIAVNPATGNVIVAGGTSSGNFPGTVGGAQPGHAGGVDAFVSVFTSDLRGFASSVDRIPPLPPARSRMPPRTVTRD